MKRQLRFTYCIILAFESSSFVGPNVCLGAWVRIQLQSLKTIAPEVLGATSRTMATYCYHSATSPLFDFVSFSEFLDILFINWRLFWSGNGYRSSGRKA